MNLPAHTWQGQKIPLSSRECFAIVNNKLYVKFIEYYGCPNWDESSLDLGEEIFKWNDVGILYIALNHPELYQLWLSFK